MPKFFLQSTTNPKVRFEILGRDKEAGTMKLKGQYSEFEEPMDRDLMAKYKYTIVKEEDHADAV